MRLFYRRVYSEFIDSTTERFTSSQFDTLLAWPEILIIQVRAYRISGTSPTLTLRAYRSNDQVDWSTAYVTVSAAPLTPGTVFFNVYTNSPSTFEPGKFLRLSVALGGTSPSAEVELVVCGRGESRLAFLNSPEARIEGL